MLENIVIADMHTHSESSHDSVCKIEDMLKKEIENGTELFAVTDHFDTASFKDYDVFSPIEKAYKTVRALEEKYGNKLLAGIEISEGFWHPDIYKKARALVDYDVLIGSVHLVRYKNLDYAYSQIDFSKLSKDMIMEYLDAYFDDMITMIDTVDFDILAHLTCPLRYINRKYKIGIDILHFEGVDISSQYIRNIIKKANNNPDELDKIKDFINPNVLNYIIDKGLYI